MDQEPSTTDARITTVIPTYRRPQLLRRALESVLSQTETRLEIFVSDNASGDGTADLLAEYAARDPRVRYVVQDENIGAARNFRFAWQQVRTRWMSFLSDDDCLLPGFYAHALETLERHPEARFFCGQTISWNRADGTHGLHPSKEWRPGTYAAGEATALMVRRLFTWTGCVLDVELCRTLGSFEDDNTFEDVTFLGRAAARHPFVTSLEPCAVFVHWDEGFSQAVAAEAAADRYAATLQALADDPAVTPEALAEMRPYLEGMPAALLSRRMRRAFRAGDWEAFDRATDALEALGPGKTSRRRLIALGRRRERNPALVNMVRRAMRWHRAWRKRAKNVGGAMTLDEVVDRYAPVLLERDAPVGITAEAVASEGTP